jgi:hypothetical protein
MEINGEALRKFYFFDNNIWLLNRVEDYDASKSRVTKCEFIKVRNMNTYYTPAEQVEQSGDGFDYTFDFNLS